jgi:flagellar basal-body rod protein FlgF
MSQQLFYIAMAGLNATMERVSAAANNLANRGTTAFKAQKPVFEALPLYGQGEPDRVLVRATEQGADLRSGAIVVQTADGTPALTRDGSLSISSAGMLQDSNGHAVLGDGFAPIVLPPLQSVTIGADGTVSGALAGQNPDQISALARIMLANPPNAGVQRRADGLFTDATAPLVADAGVRLQVGALEESNADTVGMMMDMIETSRNFQMQTEMTKMVFAAAQGQSSPLSLS